MGNIGIGQRIECNKTFGNKRTDKFAIKKCMTGIVIALQLIDTNSYNYYNNIDVICVLFDEMVSFSTPNSRDYLGWLTTLTSDFYLDQDYVIQNFPYIATLWVDDLNLEFDEKS